MKPSRSNSGSLRCRRKFLRFFPGGFRDETYFDWERGYKEKAHQQWAESLGRDEFRSLLRKREFSEIATRAVRIESRTNLLFSFEKMALRDAVKSRAGARALAGGSTNFCMDPAMRGPGSNAGARLWPNFRVNKLAF